MNKQFATKVEKAIPVFRSWHDKIDNLHWLELKVDDWDGVRENARDILLFDGREYGWSCWNSDRLVSIFRSPPWSGQSSGYATKKRRA